MDDYLVRLMTNTGNMRGLACVTTDLVSQAHLQHGTLPTASDALGRALTCGVMMGALLKGKARVSLKFEGSGPLKKILVEANSQGEVRGYVGNPKVDFPHANGKTGIASAIGKAGLLTVMKDLGLKEPYKGIVQLYSSEIAEDVAYYLAESEQIPSAVGVGVLVAPDHAIAVAGGFLVQSLPPADESMINRVVQQIRQMPPLTDLLVRGHTPEQIISMIFSDIPYEILGTQPVAWKCSCSKARLEQALISLGTEELKGLIQEGNTELVCEFCRTPYLFTREELAQLVNTIQ